ncbi:MAG: fibronectin type III domain-containing protein, partial [bacterium]
MPPSAPTGFEAQGTDNGSVFVTWDANLETDITGYTIYYGQTPVAQAPYEQSASVGKVTEYVIKGLDDGTYFLSIRAKNEAGLMSPYAPEQIADVTTPIDPDVPTAPKNVRVYPSETIPGCATVTWSANPEEENIGGYVVYYGPLSVDQRQTGEYAHAKDVGNATSAQICSLEEGWQYFAVTAYNTSGLYSSYSSEQSVDIVAPDITPPTFSDITPPDGATGVSQKPTITFIVLDEESGVDASSIQVEIEGYPDPNVDYTEFLSGYYVVCETVGLLSANELITVNVTVSDRATYPEPNAANKSWTFTTGDSRPVAPTASLPEGTTTGCVQLAWNQPPGGDITGFTVYWGTESVGQGQASEYQNSQDVGKVNSDEICGLVGTYYFAVRARNRLGLYSDYSNEVSLDVINDVDGPLPPQHVQARESTPGCVTVTWEENSEPDIAGYKIYHGPVGQSPGKPDSLDVGNTTSAEIPGFEQGIYYFMVRAYDTSDLHGDYSTEKRVTVLGVDDVDPKISVGGPRDGETGVQPDKAVWFQVSDGQTGVDINSLSVTINGSPQPDISSGGEPAIYWVVCRPEEELPLGATIEVEVVVSDFGGNTATKQWEYTTAGGVPSAPTGLHALATNPGCMNLTWSQNPEADIAGYVIYYGTASVEDGDSPAYSHSLPEGLITSQSVCELEEGTYYVALKATNESGMFSDFSGEESIYVRNGSSEN